MPVALNSPQGAANHNGRLLIIDRSGDQLWRLDPTDDKALTGTIALVGTFPQGTNGMRAATAATSHGGRLLVADGGEGSLWNINPSSPSSTTGAYGRLGFLVSNLGGETRAG